MKYVEHDLSTVTELFADDPGYYFRPPYAVFQGNIVRVEVDLTAIPTETLVSYGPSGSPEARTVLASRDASSTGPSQYGVAVSKTKFAGLGWNTAWVLTFTEHGDLVGQDTVSFDPGTNNEWFGVDALSPDNSGESTLEVSIYYGAYPMMYHRVLDLSTNSAIVNVAEAPNRRYQPVYDGVVSYNFGRE